jgi:hypothetical protein
MSRFIISKFTRAARAFFMAVLCAVVFGVTPQAHAGTGAGSVILDEQFSDNRFYQ